MTNKIDFAFISELEGGQLLKGYVPDKKKSQSGVTIATGFDLGARNEFDLTKLKLGAALVKKLKPYLGLKSVDADKYLKENPLTVTKPEAETIDKAVKSAATEKLIRDYNLAVKPPLKKFAFLPAEAQTVIASVSYQYGSLSTKTPAFWKAVTKQDWKEAQKLLNNFNDRYPTRRKKEAVKLAKIVK